MRLFNQVVIVGTGLIGGSMALELKKKKLCGKIIGIARHQKSLDLAKKKKIIDSGSLELDIIKEADLVILAVPPEVVLKLAPKIAKLIKPGCIVIDVASTKEKIVEHLGKLFLNFIGTHPLAGSEKRGIENARELLFKDSLCILTSTKKTNRVSLNKIKILWTKLGARILVLTPEEHDRVLAFTSHLAHAVAFSLISSVPEKAFKLSAGGLRDTTRIAASDPQIWQEIFLANRDNLVWAIERFEGELLRLKSAILNHDQKNILKFLTQAKKKRDSLK